MSSTSFNSVFPTAIQYQPAPAKESLPSAKCLTDAKIKRIAGSVIAALALIGAGLLIASAIVGFIASPAGWVAIPVIALLAIAGGAIYAATRKDYEDPKELAEMKRVAVNQHFHTLYKEHGASHLVQDLFNEPGTTLSFESLQNKFKTAIDGLGFEALSEQYNLRELSEQGIAPEAWSIYIQGQVNQLEAARLVHRETTRDLDHRYSGRTERLQREVREIRDDLNWNYAVHNLNRRDPNRRREAFWTHTAIDAGAAVANLAISLSDEPARQQQDYDAGMAQEHAELAATRQRLEQEYSANYRQYLN